MPLDVSQFNFNFVFDSALDCYCHQGGGVWYAGTSHACVHPPGDCTVLGECECKKIEVLSLKKLIVRPLENASRADFHRDWVFEDLKLDFLSVKTPIFFYILRP